MNVYNTLLLARHPLLQPLVKGFYLGRPRFQVWTDASGKGYGAHLGGAGNPIALYQQKRLPFIEIQPVDAAKSIKPLDNEIATHEVAALFLSLNQWKPLLHGSYVEAHLDNAHIHAALQTAATPRGTEATVAMVEAIGDLIRTADIKLKVQLIKGSDNKLADALSRLAQRDHPTYTDSIRSLMDRDEKKDAEVQALFDRIANARLRGQVYTSHKVPWAKATLNWLSRTRKAVLAALFNTDRFSTRGTKSTPRIDHTASQRGQIVAGNIQDGAVKAGGNLGAIRPDIAELPIVDEISTDILKYPEPAKTSATELEAGESVAAGETSNSDSATIPQQSIAADPTSNSPTETNATTTGAAQDTEPADKSLANNPSKQKTQTAKMAMNFEMPNKTKVSVSIESAIGVSVKISAENPFQTAKTIIMLEVASIEKPAEEPAAIKDVDHPQPAGLSDEPPIQKDVGAEKREKEAKGVGAKPAKTLATTEVGATEPIEPAAKDLDSELTGLSGKKVKAETKAEMNAAAKAEKKAEKKAKKTKKVETKPVNMPAKKKTKAAKTDLVSIGEAKDTAIASPQKKVEPVKTWKEEVKAAKVDGIVSEASASTKKEAELGKTGKKIVAASPPPDQGT